MTFTIYHPLTHSFFSPARANRFNNQQNRSEKCSSTGVDVSISIEKMCGANLTGYLESPPMKTETPSVKIVAIAADEAGQRIDNFLRTQLKGVPKSMIYRILRKGEVRVNKKRIKPEYKLEAGDEVRIPPVRVAEREEEAVSPHLQKVAALADVILYEDDHILVLNKPSGTAVHGGSGLSFGVIEGLRALRPEARFLELVHRLDRDTSGVLLVAKKTLRAAFAA